MFLQASERSDASQWTTWSWTVGSWTLAPPDQLMFVFFLETGPTFRSSSSAESLDDRDASLKISTRNRQLEILFDFAISFILCRWNHWSWKLVDVKGVWDEASFMLRQAWAWQQLADLFRVFFNTIGSFALVLCDVDSKVPGFDSLRAVSSLGAKQSCSLGSISDTFTPFFRHRHCQNSTFRFISTLFWYFYFWSSIASLFSSLTPILKAAAATWLSALGAFDIFSSLGVFSARVLDITGLVTKTNLRKN